MTPVCCHHFNESYHQLLLVYIFDGLDLSCIAIKKVLRGYTNGICIIVAKFTAYNKSKICMYFYQKMQYDIIQSLHTISVQDCLFGTHVQYNANT